MASKAMTKIKGDKPSKVNKKLKSTEEKKEIDADQTHKANTSLQALELVKKNPLPLITGLEAITPSAKGENKFISIVNGPPLCIPLNTPQNDQNADKFIENESNFQCQSPKQSPRKPKDPQILSTEQQPRQLSPKPSPRKSKDPQSLPKEQQQKQEVHYAETRVQQIENVLDDPLVPPEPIVLDDGCSYDCYKRAELNYWPELCNNCTEIWRRWPIRQDPPPEIDPYEDFLYVGDIDKTFQPARGDIAIFHPYGPQSLIGLRTGWGFLSTYKGMGDFKFLPQDLVLRLGSFSRLGIDFNVDYLPYEKVELRVMTNNMEWRFLGGQVGNYPPKGSQELEPTNAKPVVADEKNATGAKKGKKVGGAAGKKEKDLSGTKSDIKNKEKSSSTSGKKTKPVGAGGAMTSDKEKKGIGKKGSPGKAQDGDKEKQARGAGTPTNGVVPALPEFSLDDIPNIFNTIPKLPDPYVMHCGEKTIKSLAASMICNYRYHNPGMHCGTGELHAQVGDIIIREPTAWLHDDWGNRIKRPKGSLIKWYKPPPWKRELKPGMLLIRSHMDRDLRLDMIPQCPYTPLMRSQWGSVELYIFEGLESKVKDATKEKEQLSDADREAAGSSDETTAGAADGKQKKDEKEGSTGPMAKSGKKQGSESEDGQGKKRKEKDNLKEGKGSNVKGKEDVKKEGKAGKEDSKKQKESLKEQTNEGEKEMGDELKLDIGHDDLIVKQMRWTYWGRSTHNFDWPFKLGSLDEICEQRHQAEARKALDAQKQFFVEDSGAESDSEVHAKLHKIEALNASMKAEESKNKKGNKGGGKGLEKTQSKGKGKKETKAGK